MSDKLTLNRGRTVPGRHRGRTVIADELEVETDETDLVKGPAEAARDQIAAEIRAISEPVKPATARRSDRIGSRMFNNTGTLARGIAIVEDKGAWNIVPPANRLQRGEEGDAMTKRLAELIDSIRDPMRSTRVRDAMDEVVGGMVRRR